MRISDWSSDVCSSDLMTGKAFLLAALATAVLTGCERAPRGKDYLNSHPEELSELTKACADGSHPNKKECSNAESLRTLNNKRSEEHTSALQSLMRTSYAVICVTKKKINCRNLISQNQH